MTTLKARVNGQWVTVSSGGGGGSSASEVEVSATDPIGTNPAAELWFDSDATAYEDPVQRWNSAWGWVASGVPATNPTNVPQATSNIVLASGITIKLLVGRRYKITFIMRAMTTGAFNVQMYDVTNAVGWGSDRWVSAHTNYGNLSTTWLTSGDDVTRAIEVRASSATQAVSAYPTEWYIEDVGPASLASPPVSPIPAWINMTLASGWSNLGAPWQGAQYRKVGDVVSLRGLITTTGSAITVWNPPAGYAPPTQCILSAPYAPPTGPHAAARVDVYPTFMNAVAPVNYLSLNGLSWSVTT